MNRKGAVVLALLVGLGLTAWVVMALVGTFVGIDVARPASVQQGSFVYTVTIGFDWGSGHVEITPTAGAGVDLVGFYNSIIIEARDEAGIVVASDSGSVPDCEPITSTVPLDPGDLPDDWCNGTIASTFLLPYQYGWEIWARGGFYLQFSDGTAEWYFVPYVGVPGPDERNFYLIDMLVEPTPTPQPPTHTPTPAPTSTPTFTLTPTSTPMGTLVPTSTPVPGDLAALYRQLADWHRTLADYYEERAGQLEGY